MKKMSPASHNSCGRTTSALALALVAITLPVIGADKTWDGEGADDLWQTGANWDPNGGGTAPVANDSLFFDGNVRLTPNNNFPAGTIFQNLTFNGSADVFTLSGNSVVIPNPPLAAYAAGLNAPYFGGSISNTSPNAETISLPLTLANGHHYIIGNVSSGTLNLSGAITLGSAASVTFSTGVNLTGSGLANLNGILGGWATMNPPGNWATLDGGNNVVDYTAYTDIVAGGSIASAAPSNVRITDSGANVLLAGGGGVKDINTLHFGLSPTANQTVEVATNQILRFGAKGGIINASRLLTGISRVLTIGTNTTVGPVTAGGADNTPGDLYLIETPFIGNTGNQLVMNSRITNNGTAAVTVHMFGHISFPGGAHTYSGGTYIHGGRLSATGPNTLGTGPVIVYPGGQLFLNASGTYTNAMSIAGLGNAESVGNGAIRMAARTISGTLTLLQDAATANGTISGIITGPGGLIVGAGNGNGVGTLTIGSAAGANDYAGDTTINGSNATATSTLQIASGRNNIMPHGGGKGNVILNGATVLATFNLNGTSQTINGLNSVGSTASRMVTNGAAGAATLTVGDGNASGTFEGIIPNGLGGLSLTKIGTGTQTLTGANTYTNATTVTAGSLVFGASGSFPAAAGPVTVNSNATLDVAASCPVTLATSASLTSSNGTTVVALQASGNAVTVPTLNSLGATNYVRITSIPAISTYPAQFVAIKYTTLNGTLNFGLGGALPVSPGTPFAGYISNNVANGSVDFVVTSGPFSIKWVGYGGGSPNSSWDTFTVNWATFGGSPATYSEGSFVRFDDSASNSLVNLDQVVTPAGITVTNNSLAYTIGGGNRITGLGSLSKLGSGTLILDHSGVNDFTGAITVSAGTLQIGNNDANGNLPATASVLDNGALVFARNDTVNVPNLISGAGTVTQNGTGTLNLSAANTFTGAVIVAQGTLQTGNNSALGATNGGTIVASGATLDVTANAINLGQEPITISGIGVGGGGALINSASPAGFVGPNAARVTMAGDATVGGTGRFDLRSNPTSNPNVGSLSTGGLPRKLTKVGTGTFGLIGITVDPQLGDIEIREGIFSLEAAITGVGNVLSNIIVLPGATLQMFAVTNQVNKVLTLGGNGNNNTVSATSGANTIIGPMAVTNDCFFSVNAAAVTLTLSNVITGPGKITKVGAGLLTFSGNSPSYAGGLQLNAGNMAVSGTLANTLGVNVSAGKFTLNGTLLGPGMTNAVLTTIAGSGTTAGTTDISGSLFPGDTNVIGTLTTGDFVAESSCSISFDLGFDPTPGLGSNDLIQVNGNLVVNGGTININPQNLLKNGQPYRLFNYTGNLIWNSDFSIPGVNNYTFTLDTNTPGQVRLVSSGGPPVWNGGSATVNNWSDPANWSGVTIQPGNSLYFAGATRLNNINDTTAGTTYQDLAFNVDAGAFTLNGNGIVLNGNIINGSTRTQTVLIPLSSSVANIFSGGTGAAKLIVGGGFTNISGGVISNVLSGSGILTNLLFSSAGGTNTFELIDTNAAWTLMDNPASTAIINPVQLDIEAGTFSFGQGASAPQLDSTTAINSRLGVISNSPATFNMVNGTLTIEARLNTGTAGNSIATLNQSGGTLNINALFQAGDGSSTAVSTENITGGTFNVGSPTRATFFVSSRGTGVVTVAGSGVLNCGTLDIERGISSGVPGTVNLNGGGVISATRVGTASSAAVATATGDTATFNFNGGTLQAAASSATFFQGNTASPAIPITAIVKSGGAIIDDNGFAISVLEPMQHDSSLGATLDGGLIKKGSGTLTLTAANTYTGPTAISNGTLAVNGSLAATAVTVATNGTLAGTGNLGGAVTVNAGGAISPAGAGVIGTLTVSNNVTFQPNGKAVMELSKTAATNDLLRAIAPTATTINFAGTLAVTNLAGTLANGDSFKLFSATNLTGSFNIVPSQPAIGLRWDASLLNTAGILKIVSLPNPGITNVAFSNGNLIIGGTNGTAGLSYRVLTSPDVLLPMSSWTAIGTNAFDGGGNFQFTMGATNALQFFRLQAL
jgi:autotransporter-associated beta strand protein